MQKTRIRGQKRSSKLNAPHTRREFLKTTGVLAAATTAAGLGLVKPEKILSAAVAGKEINIGTFGPSHCATPFVYSKLKGYFNDEQLTVNLTNYPTMPGIAKDLIGGKLDFGQLIVPLVFAIHTGSGKFAKPTPMTITQITGVNGAALMVRKDSGISEPADFKGKTLASHSKLTVHYLFNMMFLEDHGLDPAKDVTYKMIDLGDAVPAMGKGEVDSFIMPEPKDAVIEAKEFGDVYMLSKYIWPNHPCCALVTRRDFLDKDEGLVTAVTRAMTRGALEADAPTTREQVIDTLQGSTDYKYDKVPKKVLMKAFTPGRSDFYPFPFQSSARLIIEMMKKYGLLAQEVDDSRLATEVFQSGLSRKIMADLGADPPEEDFRAEKILGKIKNYSL